MLRLVDASVCCWCSSAESSFSMVRNMKEPANKAKHHTTTTTALVTSSIRHRGHTHTCTHRQWQWELICFVSLGVSWGFEAPDQTRPQTLLKSLCMHRNHHFLTGPHATLLHSTALCTPLSTPLSSQLAARICLQLSVHCSSIPNDAGHELQQQPLRPFAAKMAQKGIKI